MTPFLPGSYIYKFSKEYAPIYLIYYFIFSIVFSCDYWYFIAIF